MPTDERYVSLHEIADWLGLTYANLQQRIWRARQLGFEAPPTGERGVEVNQGRMQVRRWGNTAGVQREWRDWNRRYGRFRAAIQSHPRVYTYTEPKLRRLWREGGVERWLEHLNSVIWELIAVDDPAARHVDIPLRVARTQFQAIDPELIEVPLSYVNNLRAWARTLADRIRAVDDVVEDWPAPAATQWAALRTKYLSRNCEAVLNRCAGWGPRTG